MADNMAEMKMPESEDVKVEETKEEAAGKEKITKEEDNEFELFVLEQVKTYGDMHKWASKAYTICIFGCIALCVVGIVMGKSIWGALMIGLWSLGFYAARGASIQASESVYKDAKVIEDAIADPNFDIPDDYPNEILALRNTVCPTLKNTRALILAYGIIAVMCWIGTIVIAAVTTSGDSVEWGLFMTSWIMGGMALGLTILTVRAIKNLPGAKRYEEYLNRKAQE